MGEGIALIIRLKFPAQAGPLAAGIDDQGVEHHDLALRDVVLPGSAEVGVHLGLVQDGGADDDAVLLLHEELIPGKSSLRRGPGGVDVPEPADAGPACFDLIVDARIDAADRVQVGGSGFPNGDDHEDPSHCPFRQAPGREKLPRKPWLPGECSVLRLSFTAG